MDREEVEIKFAYFDDGRVSHRALAGKVQLALEGLLRDGGLKFPALVGESPYRVDSGFTDFVFVDLYFDDEDHNLFYKDLAYRLRYRFRDTVDYYMYKNGFGLSYFYPNRCEVQLKGPYERLVYSGLMKVLESRFEFTQGAEPFVEEMAPPAPWPRGEYISISSKGRFSHYHMQPHARLEEELGFTPKLSMEFETETIRYRNHLSLKNPFGTGPNPDHVFIVTIDHARVVTGKGEKDPKSLVEIEIELDRNISRGIQQALAFDLSSLPHGYGYFKTIADYSYLAQVALDYDRDTIRNRIKKVLMDTFKSEPLAVDNKYSRLHRMIY